RAQEASEVGAHHRGAGIKAREKPREAALKGPSDSGREARAGISASRLGVNRVLAVEYRLASPHGTRSRVPRRNPARYDTARVPTAASRIDAGGGARSCSGG